MCVYVCILYQCSTILRVCRGGVGLGRQMKSLVGMGNIIVMHVQPQEFRGGAGQGDGIIVVSSLCCSTFLIGEFQPKSVLGWGGVER
jgi:hypothetical protein